jgi:hypothetical protein
MSEKALVLRCETTGNPCGTDTWAKNYECSCAHCQAYLHPTGPFADVIASARREIARWTKERRESVQLQGDPRYISACLTVPQ